MVVVLSLLRRSEPSLKRIKLAKYGINAILCDDTHLPCSNLLPINTHYKPYGVLKKQIALTDAFKNLLWQRIVKAKIINQVQR